MAIAVRETEGLTADERRQAVRAVMRLASTPAGLAFAAVFARATLRDGDQLCRGEITRAEFLVRQERALLAALEGIAAG